MTVGDFDYSVLWDLAWALVGVAKVVIAYKIADELVNWLTLRSAVVIGVALLILYLWDSFRGNKWGQE